MKAFFVTFVILFFACSSVSAEQRVVYINLEGLTQEGVVASELVNNWIKNNPNKKVVSFTVRYHQNERQWGYIAGVWILYEDVKASSPVSKDD